MVFTTGWALQSDTETQGETGHMKIQLLALPNPKDRAQDRRETKKGHQVIRFARFKAEVLPIASKTHCEQVAAWQYHLDLGNICIPGRVELSRTAYSTVERD